jgi:hypothetical protein
MLLLVGFTAKHTIARLPTLAGGPHRRRRRRWRVEVFLAAVDLLLVTARSRPQKYVVLLKEVHRGRNYSNIVGFSTQRKSTNTNGS